jgi:hypothetical protein
MSITDISLGEPVIANFDLPVVRGDHVYIGVEESGSYPSSWTVISAVFTSTTAGQSIVSGKASGTPSTSTASYTIPQGNGFPQSWTTNITSWDITYAGLRPMVFKDLYMVISANPSPGTRTIQLMRNANVPEDTCEAVFAPGVTVFSDNKNTIFNVGDRVGPMKHTPTGTPVTTGTEQWSFVMTIL